MPYDIYPAVDEGYNFPPEVRQSAAASPELQATIDNRVGDVVDALVAEAISDDATIQAAAENAIEPAIREMNAVRAFPETAMSTTTRTNVPIFWTNKTLDDPMTDFMVDEFEGTWAGSVPFRGDVPILNSEGVLDKRQVPSAFVTREELPDLLPENEADFSELEIALRVERVVSKDLPIFAARIAKAKTLNVAAAVVYNGSSTTGTNPGYTKKLHRLLQNLYPMENHSALQYSNLANFGKIESPGLHGYNTGEGGTTAETYLNDRECGEISSLDPVLMTHMVGSNDWRLNVSPATYKANVLGRLAYLDSVLPNRTQHVLFHAYPRLDTNNAYSWSEYGQALAEIAEVRDDTVVFDLTPGYSAIGIPGQDYFDFVSTDQVHQTQSGYNYMAETIASLMIG